MKIEFPVWVFGVLVTIILGVGVGVMETQQNQRLTQIEMTTHKLSEVVGKTPDGKDLTRLDTYDIVSGIVIKSVQESEKGKQ